MREQKEKQRKRRRISKFYNQHRACKDFNCDHCDTPITATMVYDREVFAFPKRIEVERRHAKPDCPDAYYTGN